ncbi:MAG TPA: phosphoribosyltransferase family protein [Anaerolineales bacterium]|nr:phosphoribosyltransferase family protein [Anaerolineales bacterium]
MSDSNIKGLDFWQRTLMRIDRFVHTMRVTWGDVKCYACEQDIGPLCKCCAPDVYPIEEPCCERCGYPFGNSTQNPTSSPKKICYFCKKYGYGLDSLKSAVFFDGAAKKLVLNAKFRHRPNALRYLAEWMVERIHRDFPADAVLVPVPLSAKRKQERGYNQAEILARHLAFDWNLPIDTQTLYRAKHTQALSSSDTVLARRQIVAQAFSTRTDHFKNKTVILIDDVCTTSTTLTACALACKQAGARSVLALTATRGRRPWDSL